MNFTYTPKYKKTPSDELFKQLYCFYPKKAGTSHELISTATYWHLIEKDNIVDVILENKFVESKHDVRVKDVAEHQIDGIVELKNKKGKIIRINLFRSWAFQPGLPQKICLQRFCGKRRDNEAIFAFGFYQRH